MKSSSLPSHLLVDRLSLIDERRKDNQDASPKSNYYSSDLHRTSSSSTSSKSIPIKHDHIKSQEDWDFRLQEMLAEERDHSMFVRIVNGMIARQGSEHSSSDSFHSETDKIISRIMRTRYNKFDNKSPSGTDDSEIFAYDDQTELTYNGHRNLPHYQHTEEDDRPPDAIFIIDM